jgi:hypothetical protein
MPHAADQEGHVHVQPARLRSVGPDVVCVHPRAPAGELRSVVVADADHRTQSVTTARILGCQFWGIQMEDATHTKHTRNRRPGEPPSCRGGKMTETFIFFDKKLDN